MQTGRIVSLTGSSCARRSLVVAMAVSLTMSACSSREPATQRGDKVAAESAAAAASGSSSIADTLARVCPDSARRGSLLVARPDDKDEESRVTFKLLGDGAGPGVVLCRDVLYADAAALLGMMGERGTVTASNGTALIDSTRTAVPAYLHDGIAYVAVTPFARYRRALLVPSTDHPMDATIWPRETLLHMKSLGGDRRGVYDQAVREGLFP